MHGFRLKNSCLDGQYRVNLARALVVSDSLCVDNQVFEKFFRKISADAVTRTKDFVDAVSSCVNVSMLCVQLCHPVAVMSCEASVHALLAYTTEN